MNRLRLSVAVLAAFAIAGCRATESAPRAATLPTTQTAATRPASLQVRLDQILNRNASTGAFVAARVVDPETGTELFAQDADRPVTPASNMKLVVTTAAIDFFGTDAVWETDLAIVGDDFYLIGHGDPGTGDDQIAAKTKGEPTTLIDKWADELLAKGVTRIAGNFFYFDGAFEKQQTHPTWGTELNEWYAAPVGGLNFNDNCVDAVATPNPIEGQPPTIELIPETSNSLTLINRAVTGKEDNLDWSREASQNVFTITGTLAKVTKLQSKPVTDPGAFFADAVRTHFAKRGITIAGQIVRADTVPTGTMTKLVPAKTKFVDILERINKNSQNMLAEGAAKKLGREHLAMRVRVDDPSKIVGSWANADAAIRDFWQRNNIEATGFQFADGSGLSRENKVTTRLISELLLLMYRKPYFETFKNSMTVAGVDGTTRNRLKDKPGRVFCKTGYISGVRSLSGYVQTDSGKLRVFSFIYNKIPGRGIASTKAYEDMQDDALRELMKD